MCTCITLFSGACLLAYYFANKNRRIERFYAEQKKQLYLLLKFVNFVLMVSFAFNSRFIGSHLFKILTRYIKNKWMNTN
jgi:hypothetical protein